MERVLVVVATTALRSVVILLLVIINLFFTPFSLGQNALEGIPGFRNNMILLFFLESLIESAFYDFIIVTQRRFVFLSGPINARKFLEILTSQNS